MNRPPLSISLSVSLLLFSVSAGRAQETEPQVTLDVGDPAPSFTLKDDQGKDWNSEDHFGEKIVVLYFYPADMTSGCTKQACAYRDHLEEFKSAGVEVVGISGDSVRNHQLFKEYHNLNFTLLADVNGEAARKFGVPYTAGHAVVKKEIDGTLESLVREITPHRWTFVIGKDKTVKFKDDRVKPAEDSARILELLDELES
jgi:peroxiredoxin Q/BCP